MEKDPEISLIVCTMNRAESICDTLDCALHQDLPYECYEIIVIDQSTDDETKKLVEVCTDVRYIKLNSRGLSISRNEGIKEAKGRILVFVDDDVEFGYDYLKNILNFFDTSELRPDFIGGRTLIKYLDTKPDWIDGPLLGILAHSDYGDEPALYDSHPKHCPYGCNMAIRKDCLIKVNGFSNLINSIDKDLTENEDVIFGNKLRQLGYNLVYCPNMVAYHKMPASRLNYEYYKKRYLSQGRSDAYIYYLLKIYSKKDIPFKVIQNSKRLLESLILRHFKKIPQEKYYQKLRLYYNAGYIKSLMHILLNKEKIDENS